MREETPKEIERKYLIRMPSPACLAEKAEHHADKILQTYLRDADATTRVRRRERDGKVTYTRTSKVRINVLTSYEDERTLTEAEYLAELERADPTLTPIEKVRHVFRENGHLFEIDIYPFWDAVAVMEVELEREDQPVALPEGIEILAEVTADKRFKNRFLAAVRPDITPYLKARGG